MNREKINLALAKYNALPVSIDICDGIIIADVDIDFNKNDIAFFCDGNYWRAYIDADDYSVIAFENEFEDLFYTENGYEKSYY